MKKKSPIAHQRFPDLFKVIQSSEVEFAGGGTYQIRFRRLHAPGRDCQPAGSPRPGASALIKLMKEEVYRVNPK